MTLTLGHGQTRNVAQYPLHNMTYAPAKFEAAMSNGLGGNAFTRNIWFDLDQGQGHMKHCPLHHVTYVPAKFEVATANGKGDALPWKYIIWPWPQGQGHTKCSPVPSTLCDLCNSEMWCCYIPWLRRRCIYKKIHYLTLTLGSRSHKMLPMTLDIMWPMRQQSLILLHPKVKHLHQWGFRRIYLSTNPSPHDPQNLLLAQANRPMKTPGRIFSIIPSCQSD